MLKRVMLALVLSALALVPVELAWAQIGIDGLPPNRFHPFRGATNCVQVVNSLGNFQCAPGTTVDPATGNMVVGGTLSFQGLTAGTFSNGLALAAVGSGVQLLGAGDLTISTSPKTIATSGPLIRGVTLRVRQGPAGTCQLVVAGGNGFSEYVIPTLNTLGLNQSTFPGGPGGC